MKGGIDIAASRRRQRGSVSAFPALRVSKERPAEAQGLDWQEKGPTPCHGKNKAYRTLLRLLAAK